MPTYGRGSYVGSLARTADEAIAGAPSVGRYGGYPGYNTDQFGNQIPVETSYTVGPGGDDGSSDPNIGPPAPNGPSDPNVSPPAPNGPSDPNIGPPRPNGPTDPRIGPPSPYRPPGPPLQGAPIPAGPNDSTYANNGVNLPKPLKPGGSQGGGGLPGGRAGGAGGPFPQGPGAGGAPGGVPGGSPGKPAGNPAAAGALQGLGNQYGQAYQNALRANQQLYGNIMDLYHQAGSRQLQNQQNIDQRYNALQGQTQTYLNPLDEAYANQQGAQAGTQARYDNLRAETLQGIQGIDASQRQQIKDVYAQQAGHTQQSAISRGIGNTTVLDSLQRGNLADREKAEVNLTNQTQALTAGYGSQLGLAAAGYSNAATQQNTAQQNARGNARAGYGSQIGLGAIGALADAGRQNTALDLSQANWMNQTQIPYPSADPYNQAASQIGQIYGAGGGGVLPNGAAGGYNPGLSGFNPSSGSNGWDQYPPVYGAGGALGRYGAGGALAGLGGPGGNPEWDPNGIG